MSEDKQALCKERVTQALREDLDAAGIDGHCYARLLAPTVLDFMAEARAAALNEAADAWDGKGAGLIKQMRIGMGSHSAASVAKWLRRAAEAAR